MDIPNAVSNSPEKPGVYIWKGNDGEILYVGKAKNIFSRLKYYLDPQDVKTKLLMRDAASVEYIVTENEVEALILESTLIKNHEPYFNVRLKDGKKYPYLKVTVNEEAPAIYVTRNPTNDGSKYFGPYVDTSAMRQALKVVRRQFGIRGCRGDFDKLRLCLDYHIKNCSGPCEHKVQPEKYMADVEDACRVLSGDSEPLLKRLNGEMASASANLKYEDAAKVRDKIRSIESITRRQHAESFEFENLDVIAYSVKGANAGISVISVRGGKILSNFFYRLAGEYRSDPSKALSSFIQQYYEPLSSLPTRIVTVTLPEDSDALARWFIETKGVKVDFLSPKDENTAAWARIAQTNASVGLAAAETTVEDASTRLQNLIKLSDSPTRIEGYDATQLFGAHRAVSMVVFEDEEPAKSEYRLFNIQTQSKDDASFIKEAISRRAKHTEWRTPDLILVDGGLQQLAAAQDALSEEGLSWPVVALAKQEELVYVPGRPVPLKLSRRDLGLRLLQNVRDEAHRFVNAQNKRLQKKEGLSSALDSIKGVGPARRRLLLERFGSVAKIAAASVKELTAVPGVSPKTAEAIIAYLNKKRI
ncbi:UvrABC system protein C [uncultured archaeon]|nr:UvrABC system protein C [uncultured archaeon]